MGGYHALIRAAGSGEAFYTQREEIEKEKLKGEGGGELEQKRHGKTTMYDQARGEEMPLNVRVERKGGLRVEVRYRFDISMHSWTLTKGGNLEQQRTTTVNGGGK